MKTKPKNPEPRIMVPLWWVDRLVEWKLQALRNAICSDPESEKKKTDNLLDNAGDYL